MRTPLIGSLIMAVLGAAHPARAEEAEPESFDPCTRPDPTQLTLELPAKVEHLDVSIIRRYLRRMKSRMMYCWEKQLLVKPELQGSVQLAYTIDPTGETSAVAAKGFDKDVDDCLVEVIDDIHFPKPKDGASVALRHEIKMLRDDGTRVFDTDSTVCKELPAPLVTYASKLVRAIEEPGAAGEKAFLALLPATVKFHGKKLTRAKVKKDIKAIGSVDGWLTLGSGDWMLAKYRGEYRLQRGAPDNVTGLYVADGNGTLEEPASVLRFKKVKGAWRLVEVVSE